MKSAADPISLSDLQLQVKETLERSLSEGYWITAEINELKIHSSGHCYLELIEKDESLNTIRAKASGTIWAYSFRMLKPYFETTTGTPLAAGLRVLVKAGIQYHPVYGLSLSITDIDPAYTVGEIALQRRKTIAQLQADGVFDINRELEMPILPQRIAIISSEQAAGYRDFMNHLYHNEYGFAFRTQLFPALMQGAAAPQSMMDALTLVNNYADAFDVLVIIRGGGSVSDLACFDDYELASYVAQFPLPVLTGIGHDKDESVTDMVAHTALKTPTAVAGFFLDCFLEQQAMLEEWSNSIATVVQNKLQTEQQKLSRFIVSLRNVARWQLKEAAHRLQLTETTLRFKDPATILARGYAVASRKGKALTDASEIDVGEELAITLQNGKLHTIVHSIKLNES